MSKSPYRNPGEREMYDIKIDKKIDWKNASWNVFCYAFWITIGFAVAFIIIYLPFKVFSVDGKADYCYMKPEVSANLYTGEYTLIQHVPWRADRELLRDIKTAEEARAEAQKFECPIK